MGQSRLQGGRRLYMAQYRHQSLCGVSQIHGQCVRGLRCRHRTGPWRPGYRIHTNRVAFEPFANLAYVNFRNDGFNETGGADALAGSKTTTDTTFTTLGLRASTDFTLGGMTATARGMLGWRHAFGDTTPESNLAFTGSDPFVVLGAPIAEDALALEEGLDFKLTPHATLGISYNGQLASKAQDNAFKADVSFTF
jgi:outer membrane autotransporter protein